MAIEIPPTRCYDTTTDEDDIDWKLGGARNAEGQWRPTITLTSPKSPIGVVLFPFPPFVFPIFNWEFFFGDTDIEIQKDGIQRFFTPFMRYAKETFGYPLRDNKALWFGSNDVRKNFARCPALAALAPQLLEDAPILVQCQGGKAKEQGYAERTVNQFLATACVNQWTVEQTGELWDAIVQAVKPLDTCPPKCLTAVQVARYLLKGNAPAPGMQEFLCEEKSWDTNVLYCFPADFPIAGCPVPPKEPPPCPEGWVRQQDGTCKPPVVVKCQAPMVEMPDGTCACPLPDPPPKPQPCPPGWIRWQDGSCHPPVNPYPQPDPTPVPQPQACPPACQTQIDQVRECCQEVTRRVTQEVMPEIDGLWRCCREVWENITRIYNDLRSLSQLFFDFRTEVWNSFGDIWNILNDIDIRIDTHIENYYCTIIKPYIDEMCERCKAQEKPPPDETKETNCEEGRRKWGLWAECWLEAHTPAPEDVGDGIAWCDSMATLKATCAQAAQRDSQGRWADAMTLARQAVANGLQGNFGVDVLPGVEALDAPAYVFEEI
jgi:hypothetical protein